ncbi:GlyGly-CTERM sorting domain-containing protein [Photobacterium sp. GB-1]
MNVVNKTKSDDLIPYHHDNNDNYNGGGGGSLNFIVLFLLFGTALVRKR